MTNLVILDNTVLSNFAIVNRPEIVLGLWPGISYTTPAVREEYQSAVHIRAFPRHC